MKSFISNLFGSLDNHSLGYSGRKLTALFSALMGAVLPSETKIESKF